MRAFLVINEIENVYCSRRLLLLGEVFIASPYINAESEEHLRQREKAVNFKRQSLANSVKLQKWWGVMPEILHQVSREGIIDDITTSALDSCLKIAGMTPPRKIFIPAEAPSSVEV